MRITQFEGMAPKVDPSRLAEGLAEKAVNATFQRGALTAFPIGFEGKSLSGIGGPTTGSLSRARGLFYSHMADAWFAFNSRVSGGVDSLIAPEDAWSRIYFADANGPKFMTGDQYTNGAVNLNPSSFLLGVPAPASAPTASVTWSGVPAEEDETATRQRVFYIYTLVDQFGAEGPPSAASNHADIPTEYDFTVEVTLPISGNDISGRGFGSSARKRIYRATQGTQGAAYQFVGEVPYATSTFTDNIAYGDEQEVIPSEGWYPPPEEIKDIDAIASNFLAGFHGSMLCYSEVKLPHAWPYRYRFPLRHKIVAIKSTANGLFIGTTGKPYWAYGADPEAAIPQEMDYDYPCLSFESVIDMGGVVVFASHDGLVGIDGREARLLTVETFTERDWKDLSPETMKGFSFEGRYFFYSTATDELYALDPGNPRSLTLIEWPSSLGTALANISVMGRDSRRDRCLLAIGSGTASPVVEITNAASVTVEWDSPHLKIPPRAYTLGQVVASEYPVQLTVRGGDRTHSVTVQNERLFRLPSWPLSREWQVKLAFDAGGDDRRAVYSVTLGRNGEEFVDGQR